MPLDESSRRFAFLLQRDLRRIEDRERARRDRGDEVRYDAVSRVATWETRRGDVVGRWYGESLATYNARDRILRWSWAFRATTEGGTHAELVFKEGQSKGVPQLSMSVVNDVTEEEAMTLARLGAVAARADGIHVQKKEGDEDSLELIGLFESSRPSDRLKVPSANRISVPPPPVAPSRPTPTPRAAHRSLPPVTELYEPRGSNRPGLARDEPVDTPRSAPPPSAAEDAPPPTRDRLVPLANMAIVWCGQRSPGFLQGLLVMTVDNDARGRHLVVQLVVLDAHGHLNALDPPLELVEAAVALSGDARWRKLTARITPKQDGGATLHVDVL
jgi:hypothetical protein